MGKSLKKKKNNTSSINNQNNNSQTDESQVAPRIPGTNKARVVPQTRRRAEPKLEVIKVLERDFAICDKTYDNNPGVRTCGNYSKERSGVQQHFPHNLGKLGVIEDGGYHGNYTNLKPNFGPKKNYSRPMQPKTAKGHPQNQPNSKEPHGVGLVKDVEFAVRKHKDSGPLRRKENCESSNVLHYTVCLHGWGNLVLFCDSVAL